MNPDSELVDDGIAFGVERDGIVNLEEIEDDDA